MTRISFMLVVLVALGARSVLAADVQFDESLMSDRMAQLEAETTALRAEVARMSLPQPQGVVPASMETPVAPAPPPGASPVASLPSLTTPPTSSDADYFTLSELKGEMKKLVWRKGDFSVTPYGWLWGAMAYETERSQPGDYALYVLSAQDQGESSFHVDARGTRLGVDIGGPRIPFFDCATSGGKVEFDFNGAYVTENKPGVLLRHAYWEVKNEDFRILGGQTWDVISPLNPGTIMYSVYWGAGNIGYRRAQFRGERYLKFNDIMMLTFQGSINSDIVSDVPTVANTYTGDHAAWPVLEGRTAFTLGQRGKGCQPITLGVSGHYGEQVFDFSLPPVRDDVYIHTWSTCVDLRVPITDRFGFQGEYFMGENLGTFLGGIMQGVNTTQRRAIYSHGGWLELWYDITPRLHSHVGYTIDDPLDSNLSGAGARTYNSAVWGNMVFDITKQFQTGLELSSWNTTYLGKTPGESVRLEFMAKYCF